MDQRSVQWQKLSGIFKSEYQGLIRYVKGRLSDLEGTDPEDIVQDVALNLFDRIDVSLPVRNLAGYIYRSLANRITDVRRRKRFSAGESGQFAGESEEKLDSLEPFTRNGRLPADEESIYTIMYRALGELRSDEREIIEATELEGISFKQLSEEWGVPVGTLLSQKHRAVSKLRNRITELEQIKNQIKEKYL